MTEWKLLLPSWLASSSQLWLRLKRGAQRRTGSRQILGRLLSSTEIVDITSLRGSGSANPFSCGSPLELGALTPLTRLEKQRQTSVEIVLQSRQQRRLKQTAVLGCVAKPPAFKRIATMVCPLPFGLLSDISPRKRREGVRNLLLCSGLHRVTLQVRLRIWPGCGETPSSVRSIDGERSFQHVPMFPLPLRCLTPPLRLLSLMPLVCLTFILQLWMPFRKLRLEKPLASDLIPVELLKAGSSPLCLLLARLFSKVGEHRAPLAWRRGENVPVPKKFDRPLIPDTARGVLLGNAIARLWAKMIRTELAPHFALQSSAHQLGPSSGAGTDFATQAVKLHMHNATILKKRSAAVFADLKALLSHSSGTRSRWPFGRSVN